MPSDLWLLGVGIGISMQKRPASVPKPMPGQYLTITVPYNAYFNSNRGCFAASVNT